MRILVKVIGADPEGKSICLPFKYLQRFEKCGVDRCYPGRSFTQYGIDCHSYCSDNGVGATSDCRRCVSLLPCSNSKEDEALFWKQRMQRRSCIEVLNSNRATDRCEYPSIAVFVSFGGWMT